MSHCWTPTDAPEAECRELIKATPAVAELEGSIMASLSGSDGLVCDTLEDLGLLDDPKFQFSEDGSLVFSYRLGEEKMIGFVLKPVLYEKQEAETRKPEDLEFVVTLEPQEADVSFTPK